MWRRRLLLVACSTLIGLAGAELLLRALAPHYVIVGNEFYAPDVELDFRLEPDFEGVLRGVGEFRVEVRTNSRGLRGGPPAEDRPRLLGLGDSFLFGWGVEEGESFLAQAAQMLGAEPLNAGVPGYGPCRAVELGLRLAPELDPAGIVLSVFTGNDELDEALGRGSLTVVDGELLDVGTETSWQRSLRRRIYLSSHLARRVRNAPLVASLGTRLVGAPEPGSVRMLRSLLSAYAQPPPSQIAEADVRIAACLAHLAAFTRQVGIPVLVVLLPAEREVVPGKLEAELAALGRWDGQLDLDGPRRRLAALLAESGLPHVDLHEVLARAAARGELPFFRQDGHLTAAGHSLVAREVAGLLASSPRLEAGELGARSR